MPDPSKLDNILSSIGRAAPEPKYIRAYHGSPYDWDKVNMGKIGRGENTADEGHGFYSAEHPQVAEYYRDNVGVYRNFDQMYFPGATYDPSEVLTLPPLQSGEKWRVLNSWREGGDPVADLVALDRNGRTIYVKDGRRVYDANDENWRETGAVALQHLHKTVPMPREFRAVTGKDPGRVYELEIRQDPRTLLDWDADFANQSPEVQRVLNRMRSSWEPDLMPKLQPYGESPTGEQIYGAISRQYRYPGGYDAAASRRLLDEGIPGIKYFDQLSRGVGRGTRNFVSFPGTEDSIRILRKYGLMAPIAAGAAMGDGEN